MSKMLKTLGLASVLMCFASIGSANDCVEHRVTKDGCAQSVSSLIHNSTYGPLSAILTAPATVGDLSEAVAILLENNNNSTDYNNLLTLAYQIVNQLAGSEVLNTGSLSGQATKVISPRLVITAPDGTVIVDTGAWGTLTSGIYPQQSTLANWQANAVNNAGTAPTQNHNTRIAILDAQQWPCGLGVEAKYSTSLSTPGTPVFQYYVAQRLGYYLESIGTARLSVGTYID